MKLSDLLNDYSEYTVGNESYFRYGSFKYDKLRKVIISDVKLKLEKNTKQILYQLAIDLNLTKISNDSKTLLLQKINKLIS